uniref:Uncharacterized protein n=1 Tax=Arundo donax TaxID=35708 RepID=A0A0A8ZXZ8_ARUDO
MKVRLTGLVGVHFNITKIQWLANAIFFIELSLDREASRLLSLLYLQVLLLLSPNYFPERITLQ